MGLRGATQQTWGREDQDWAREACVRFIGSQRRFWEAELLGALENQPEASQSGGPDGRQRGAGRVWATGRSFFWNLAFECGAGMVQHGNGEQARPEDPTVWRFPEASSPLFDGEGRILMKYFEHAFTFISG